MKAVRIPLYLGAISRALSGCASVGSDKGEYAWSEGWREAQVIAVQTAAEMDRPRFYTCVREATPEQLATTRFAIVKYRQMSRSQRRAVPLRANERVAVGDAVYVKLGDCSTPLASAPRKASS